MKKKITEDDIRLLISRNLRRFRILRGFSQSSLAEAVGLSANFINEVENCIKSASLETIAKIATALKVEPHQFFMPEEHAGETQIYLNAFKEDIQRYVNNWTESNFPPEYGKKQ